MNIKYNIGASSENDIIYDDPSISRKHAMIEWNNESYFIEDLNSRNGTFLNDRRIKRAKFNLESVLSLGLKQITGENLIHEINKLYNQDRTDFNSEYSILLDLFNAYETRKNKILSKPLGPILIRILASIVVILVLVFFPDLIPNDALRYGLIMSVGLISVLASAFTGSPVKKQKKLDELKLEFENKLVCPKCNFSIIKYSTTLLKGRQKCFNDKCDARFKL